MQSDDGPKGTRIAEKPLRAFVPRRRDGEVTAPPEGKPHAPGERPEPVLTTRGRSLPAFLRRTARVSALFASWGICSAQTTSLATFPLGGGNFQQLLEEQDRKLDACQPGYKPHITQ